MAVPTEVVSFEDMDDETGIKHLEHRHAQRLREMNLRFRPEPERAGSPRRFRAGKKPWDIFHEHLHAEAVEHGADIGHTHEEP